MHKKNEKKKKVRWSNFRDGKELFARFISLQKAFYSNIEALFQKKKYLLWILWFKEFGEEKIYSSI